jgi:hypothetical protein
MPLFRQRPAIEGSKLPQHSSFEYLERSNRPELIRAREVIEAWWIAFPEDHRDVLLTRLRDTNPRTHDAAMFELLVCAMLQAQGHNILEVEPSVDGTERSPDFLVQQPSGEEYFLELTEARNQDEAALRTDGFQKDIAERLSGLNSEEFILHVKWKGEIQSLQGIRETISKVGAWLQDLDYEALRREAEIWRNRPKLLVKKDNYEFEVSATPRTHRVAGPCLGTQSFGVRAATSWLSFKRNVERKAGRYGRLDRPYVVAVNIHDFAVDTDSELSALYGPLQCVFQMDRETGEELYSRFEFSGDGCFIHRGRPVNTRVSSVWVFRKLTALGGSGRKSCIYEHPFAACPIRLEIDADRCDLDTDAGEFRPFEGQSMNSLLGLSDEWPSR